MEKKDIKDTKDKIAAEPGEKVKDWMDKEGTDFDDNLESAKKMAEEKGNQGR